MKGVAIKGTGHYLPSNIMTNKDLEKLVDTNDEWITTRTGIKQRHILEDDKATSDICYEAGKKALEKAQIDPKDIDMIIVGTSTPDMLFPATACLVQKKLGCRDTIPAFDFEIACTSFVYGMTIASQFIQTGFSKNILFIAADTMSRVIDYTDRGTCILFGDGGAAVVLSATDFSQHSLLGIDLGANGSFPADYLCIPGGGSLTPMKTAEENPKAAFLKMNGAEIYRLAVKHMSESLEKACENAHIQTTDLDFVIPHQANIRIMNSIVKHMNLDQKKLISTIQDHGNTSGSTIGIALDLSIENKTIKRGDLLGLTAFGAGLSWGSIILRY